MSKLRRGLMIIFSGGIDRTTVTKRVGKKTMMSNGTDVS